MIPVKPSDFWRARISAASFFRRGASRAESGSSKRISSGWTIRVRARATRCASPPESVSGIRFPKPERLNDSRNSSARRLPSFRPIPMQRSPYETLSATSMCGKRFDFWNTIPTPRFAGGRFVTSFPPIAILVFFPSPAPFAEFRSSPAIRRSKVDFPLPLGPTMHVIVPRAHENEDSSLKFPQSNERFSATRNIPPPFPPVRISSIKLFLRSASSGLFRRAPSANSKARTRPCTFRRARFRTRTTRDTGTSPQAGT